MLGSSTAIGGKQWAVPKWQEVLRDLERQFAAGAFQAGASFFTLDQLCQQYGVSDITARRVFRELKSRGLIQTQGRRGTFVAEQVQRQVVFMCLRSSESASHSPGLSDDSHFFRNYLDVFHREGLDQRFEVKPISLDFCLRNLDVVAGSPVLVAMEAILKFDGERVLVDRERLDPLRQHGQVIVFRSLPGLIDDVDQVSRDLHGGIREAVTHLVNQGHRHLGMLCGRLTSVWFKPRFEGFLDALSEAGLSCDPRLIEITSGLDPQEDYAAVERLLAQDPKPTAIVCANDTRALHVLEYCRSHGLAVPQDLAVTGFDNTLEASLSSPPLTSVDGCDAEVVHAMFQLMERKMAGANGNSEHIVVSPKLVVRESA